MLQAGLEFTMYSKRSLDSSDLPFSTSLVLGLQVCPTVPSLHKAEGGAQGILHARQAFRPLSSVPSPYSSFEAHT